MGILTPPRRFEAGCPELMDAPDADPRLLEEDLRNLRLMKRWFGGLAAVRRHLEPMLERTPPGSTLRVLDLATEGLSPIDTVKFAKDVEPYNLFFLEDSLAPEDIEWFRHIRQVCSTPIAMGELFNNPREWRLLIEERLIDFLRMHVSQLGGITPARNAAIHAQIYGLRTAWHGPGDTSPVGHAANLHLDLWAPNFGIQEWCRFDNLVYDMFPGLPVVRGGYMYPNDKPGLGIEFDEALAAKYPPEDSVDWWTQTRLPDGSPARP